MNLKIREQSLNVNTDNYSSENKAIYNLDLIQNNLMSLVEPNLTRSYALNLEFEYLGYRIAVFDNNSTYDIENNIVIGDENSIFVKNKNLETRLILDKFFNDLNLNFSEGGVDEAIDHIFLFFDKNIDDNNYILLDQILQNVAVSSVDNNLLVGFLTITNLAKTKFRQRTELLSRVEKKLRNSLDYKVVNQILSGLK